MMKNDNGMMNAFLTEFVTVFISGADASVSTEDGQVADVPMVLEGILLDHDYDYILIEAEDKSMLSLINKDNIVRIDLIDKAAAEMNSVFKPDKDAMS